MGKRIEMGLQEKEYLIQACLAGRMRMREAARRAGVSHSTMHNWVSRYRSDGASTLSEDRNAQWRVYSEEIRQKTVAEYLSGQGTSMAIAEKYKLCSGNLVLDRTKEYYRHREHPKGSGGVPMARRNHTLEERVQVVREHLEEGKGFPELSEKYGTTAQVVRSWVKRYQEMGVAGLEDRRGKRLVFQTSRTTEEALRVENARLERENYLLKLVLDPCDRRIVSFVLRDANDSALIHETLDRALCRQPRRPSPVPQ